MSINLTKNKPQILDAWTKVSKGEDGYDWAIFGYEKKSLELKVVSENFHNNCDEVDGRLKREGGKKKFHGKKFTMEIKTSTFSRRRLLARVALTPSPRSSTMARFSMRLCASKIPTRSSSSSFW